MVLATGLLKDGRARDTLLSSMERESSVLAAGLFTRARDLKRSLSCLMKSLEDCVILFLPPTFFLPPDLPGILLLTPILRSVISFSSFLLGCSTTSLAASVTALLDEVRDDALRSRACRGSSVVGVFLASVKEDGMNVASVAGAIGLATELVDGLATGLATGLVAGLANGLRRFVAFRPPSRSEGLLKSCCKERCLSVVGISIELSRGSSVAKALSMRS